MIREIKFLIFSLLIKWASCFLPNDALQSWKWLSEMPMEK